jgi:hypothetical protein
MGIKPTIDGDILNGDSVLDVLYYIYNQQNDLDLSERVGKTPLYPLFNHNIIYIYNIS